MKKIILAVLALLFLLTACGQKADPDTILPVPPASSHEPLEEPSPTPEPFRNPLTGEVIEEDISELRPYAVMHNNIKVALPQCGISKADILYEVLAEGDITRLEGIYSTLDGISAIGSMRSSRPYYIELALSYDAIYVHAGGSDQAYTDISVKGVDNIDGVRGAHSGEIFYRDPNRMAGGSEHSLFTSAEKILEYTPKLGYEAKHTGSYDYGLSFTEEPDLGSTAAAATTVNVSFGGIKNTAFTYDAATGFYTGSQYGITLIDGNNNESVKLKNLLVLYAETRILDDYGRRAVELEGSGTGHFICEGKTIPIKWSRSGSGGIFKYTLENGTPLELAVGKSYIAIVPTGSTITME